MWPAPPLTLVVFGDIQPMEELVYNYGYKKLDDKSMPCLCGAKNCKKLLY